MVDCDPGDGEDDRGVETRRDETCTCHQSHLLVVAMRMMYPIEEVAMQMKRVGPLELMRSERKQTVSKETVAKA